MMPPSIKPATTYEQQIELLEKRGLIISDKVKARELLSHLNYYTFTGYLHDFKCDEGNYVPGLTFEKISNIIEFDKRFRNILMYAIETIEHTLKTKMAYNIAHNFGPEGHMEAKNFKSVKEHWIFVEKYNSSKANNKNLPFIKHHNINYGGRLPIWVAVEIFTLGMINHLYKNMLTVNQKQIASEFNTGVRQLDSWIENINYIRNLIAHYMRLYNFVLQKTPTKCNYNHKPYIVTHKIFDIIYVMKFLFFDSEEWNNYVISNLSSLFLQYETFIDKDCLGFPSDWEVLLKKII